MTSSHNGWPLMAKWEAERALAIADVEAYERQRALTEIRLLMRRYGLQLQDIAAEADIEVRQHSCERAPPVASG